MKAIELTPEEQEIADFNGNGIVDLQDAIGIAKKLISNKHKFPKTATFYNTMFGSYTADLISTHSYDIDNDNEYELIGYYDKAFMVYDNGHEYKITTISGADHFDSPVLIQNNNDDKVYLAYVSCGGGNFISVVTVQELNLR